MERAPPALAPGSYPLGGANSPSGGNEAGRSGSGRGAFSSTTVRRLVQSSVRRSHSAIGTSAEDKGFPLQREAGGVGVTRRVGHAQCGPSMRAGSPAEPPIPSAPAVRKPLDPRTWPSLKHPPACVSKPGGRSSPATPGLAAPPVGRDDLSPSLHLCHSLGRRLLLLSGSLFWHAHQVVLPPHPCQPLGWGGALSSRV